MRFLAVIALLGLTSLNSPLWATEVGDNYPSVEAFLKSLSKEEATVSVGGVTALNNFGDLTGSGRRDWADVVYIDSIDGWWRTRQVVILTQNTDGRYTVAALGPEEPADGGTGHHSLDSVQVNQGSVFVSWSWNWHGCSGDSIQRIKLYNNQWRLIGADFHQSNAIETSDGGYDIGDSASMSHNLLTGRVVIDFHPHKAKAIRKTIHRPPSNKLLDQYFSEDSGYIEEFSKYGGC